MGMYLYEVNVANPEYCSTIKIYHRKHKSEEQFLEEMTSVFKGIALKQALEQKESEYSDEITIYFDEFSYHHRLHDALEKLGYKFFIETKPHVTLNFQDCCVYSTKERCPKKKELSPQQQQVHDAVQEHLKENGIG